MCSIRPTFFAPSAIAIIAAEKVHGRIGKAFEKNKNRL